MSVAYICDGLRTPFGRYGGALAGVRPDDMAALVLGAVMARQPGLDPALVDDVVLGCANQAGEDNRNVARMAALLAGLPESVPGVTVNRLCASGLEAIGQAARAIISGQADVMLAGGAESMTRAPFVMAKANGAFSRDGRLEDTTMGWRFINPLLRKAYGVETMPETAENVAAQFQISRADQDAFALRSQQRTAAATTRGFFHDELLPVIVAAGKDGTRTVTTDEHPRPATTLEGLARLKLMKPSAYIVNTARGEVIDENCLALMLEKGELSGAGLDVFENEPAVNPKLLKARNVVLLPHMGSATIEGRIDMGEKVIVNIKSFVDGHKPPDRVIPAML